MRKLLGLIALLWLGTANAGVIYNWETITGPTVIPISGRIEVTQTAYRAGQLDYYYDGHSHADDDSDWEDPTAPLLMFAFGFYLGNGFEGDPLGGGFTNRYRTAATGAEDYQDTEAVLTFGPLLEGQLYGGGHGWWLAMSSDASGVWTGGFHRDDGHDVGGCEEGDLDLCPEITGRWVLDAGTVPTPSSLALVLLPLGLLTYGRRVRCR